MRWHCGDSDYSFSRSPKFYLRQVLRSVYFSAVAFLTALSILLLPGCDEHQDSGNASNSQSPVKATSVRKINLVNRSASAPNSADNAAERDRETNMISNSTTDVNPPPVFNLTDSDAEKAFTSGEQLGKSSAGKAAFGSEQVLNFQTNDGIRLKVSLRFMSPYEQAREKGYIFRREKLGATADDRAEQISHLKKQLIQSRQEILLMVAVLSYSNSQGEDNTPTVSFNLIADGSDEPQNPVRQTQLNFPVGKDFGAQLTQAAVVFSLFRNNIPVLTEKTNKLTVEMSVNRALQTAEFRLR